MTVEQENARRERLGLLPIIRPGHSAASTHVGYVFGCPDCPGAAMDSDMHAECLRRTLSQIELSGLRAELAKRDRTRGWLS